LFSELTTWRLAAEPCQKWWASHSSEKKKIGSLQKATKEIGRSKDTAEYGVGGFC